MRPAITFLNIQLSNSREIDDSLSGRDRTGNLYFKTDSDIIKGSMKRVE